MVRLRIEGGSAERNTPPLQTSTCTTSARTSRTGSTRTPWIAIISSNAPTAKLSSSTAPLVPSSTTPSRTAISRATFRLAATEVLRQRTFKVIAGQSRNWSRDLSLFSLLCFRLSVNGYTLLVTVFRLNTFPVSNFSFRIREISAVVFLFQYFLQPPD